MTGSGLEGSDVVLIFCQLPQPPLLVNSLTLFQALALVSLPLITAALPSGQPAQPERLRSLECKRCLAVSPVLTTLPERQPPADPKSARGGNKFCDVGLLEPAAKRAASPLWH